MKMKLMRRIDYYVGVPICNIFAILRIARNLLPFQKKADTPVKKILVIKFLGIGSISLAAPTVAALKKDFPGAEVSFLTFKNNKETLDLLSLTSKNFFIDTASLPQFFFSTCKVLIELRREKIDLALDLEFFSKFPLILSVLAGAKKNAGFYLVSEWWRKYLLDYHGFYNHYFHVKDIFLSLAYLARHNDPYYRTFDRYQKKYTLPIVSMHPELLDKVKAKLTFAGATENRPLVVINPNAGPELAPELKRWPSDYFAQLIERINSKYENISIVLVGSYGERSYVQSIIERTNNTDKNAVINLAGETTLSELLGVLSFSNVFITVDSGPMHLASLLRTNTIGLFGAETPVLYAPLNENATIICKALYSIPMFTVYNGKRSALRENIPLQLISVDEVFGAVDKYLNNYPHVWNASSVTQLISDRSK